MEKQSTIYTRIFDFAITSHDGTEIPTLRDSAFSQKYAMKRDECQELIDRLTSYMEDNTDEQIQSYNSFFEAEFLREMTPPLNTAKAAISGYIYLIESSDGLCKIGRTTKDVNSRFRQIQSLSFSELSLSYYGYVSDCCSVEYALHDYFESKCVKGEWFKLSKENIEAAKAFIADYQIAEGA